MSSSENDSPGTLREFFLRGKHNIIHKWDHYFEIYETHLHKFKGRRVTLLEIGVYKGGSLQMWKTYFGKDSRILGVDIDPACKKHEESRVEIFIGDAANKNFMREVVERAGPLDIVIDDGGHTALQQINAFEVLYPGIRDGGIYLVEDTHTHFWPGYADTPDQTTFLQFAHEKMLELHQWTGERANFDRFALPAAERDGRLDVSEFCRTTASIHFYDSIVVFEKSQRTEPRHQAIGTTSSAS